MNGLTNREVEVLQLVAMGVTNRGIAEMLVISSYTVSSHVKSILRKLGVKNRLQASVLYKLGEVNSVERKDNK